jgi:predicted transglutaminase-like cysteine proteinase
MHALVKTAFSGFCGSVLSDRIAGLETRAKVAEGKSESLQHVVDLLDPGQKRLADEVQKLGAELKARDVENQEIAGKLLAAMPYPKTTQDLINYYYAKYPVANIEYDGRPGEGSQDVKIFSLCGQNDYRLRRVVQDADAIVSKIVQESTMQGNFHKACDAAVARVTAAVKCHYVTDYAKYNVNEFWAFAPATYYMQRGDCDDWAILRHVACRIAGVPAGLLRITAGDARNGEGHATNHYLASDGKWHHPNSTTSYNLPEHPDATSFPLIDEPSDKLGIASVWFSFNEERAWHVFTTSAGEDTFKDAYNQQRLLKHIKIKGVKA